MAKLEELQVPMMRSSAQVVHLNTVRAFQVAHTVGEVKDASGNVLLTSTK